MRRFKNPNHLPNTGRSYRWNDKHAVFWPSTVPWNTFYSSVTRYATANGLASPTMEEVEDRICSQIPDHWCTSDSGYRPPARTPATSGCSACGRRR